MKLKDSERAGAVDANLQVADESPWSASLNMDNSGTQETGKTYMGALTCSVEIRS
jgi:hemolysin activation/secretion protein